MSRWTKAASKCVLAGLLALAPVAAHAVDCSGTITAGAKTVYTASNAQGVMIANNSSNLMCISFTGTAALGGVNCAQGSFPLNPGASTSLGGTLFMQQFAPTSMSIVSVGSADIYSCWRW
jgi:hypothetical protein